MARRAPQPSLSPKMLKHFAVATAALTACLALFADGEGRNDFGREMSAREDEAAAAVAAAATKVKPKFSLNGQIRDARRTYIPLPGEDGDSGTYGAPMDSAGGSGGGGNRGGGGRPQFLPGPGGPGVAQPAVVAVGGPQLVAGERGRAGPAAPRRPSREDIARLEAQSLARSGDRTED